MSYLILITLLAVGLFYFAFKYMYLYKDFSLKISNFKETELKRQMDEYKVSMQQQLSKVIEENKQMSLREAYVIAEKWKSEYEDVVRKDAVKKSQSVVAGKVTEHLLPFFPDFRWNPRDARFLGSPTDLIVFDGLSDGELKQIVFIEIKTNKSQLSEREKQIRDVINAGRVKWEEIRHMIGENVK